MELNKINIMGRLNSLRCPIRNSSLEVFGNTLEELKMFLKVILRIGGVKVR